MDFKYTVLRWKKDAYIVLVFVLRTCKHPQSSSHQSTFGCTASTTLTPLSLTHQIHPLYFLLMFLSMYSHFFPHPGSSFPLTNLYSRLR